MHETLPRLARNAYEIISKLPRHGVGTKLSRQTWKDNSFWEIAEVKVRQDGKGGKAYGMLTWRGERQHDKAVKINGSLKKVWRLLGSESPEDQQQQKPPQAWPSLAAAMLQSEKAASQEATTSVESIENGTDGAAVEDGDSKP